MYFFVNFQRGSARSVYAHITSGLVAARLAGCLPRGGNPVTAVPPCAIMVKAQGANSSANKERLVIRWDTVTAVPDGSILISISFCRFVSGSTGSRDIKPAGVTRISTGTLSGA